MQHLRTNFGECIVVGCVQAQVKRHFCGKHYRRVQRHGDPLGSKPRTKDDPQRFWAKVDKAGPIPAYRPDLGPCWIWTARLTDGYGQVRWKGRWQGAHRASWLIAFGELPPLPLQLDHLCRVRACVNPRHLEVVTQAENVHRSDVGLWQRAKTHCPQGHPYDEANTRINRGGGRACRKCAVEAQARYRLRRSTHSPSARE